MEARDGQGGFLMNDPLYYPLFAMPRTGFSREEFLGKVREICPRYSDAYATLFLDSLVAGRILVIVDCLFYFAWREDSPHRPKKETIT